MLNVFDCFRCDPPEAREVDDRDDFLGSEGEFPRKL
jgi:hypothetical protein